MSDQKIDYMSDEEAHPLALPYVKIHRHVTEVFIKEKVSAGAQAFYLYLSHNCLVRHGRTFKLDIVEIADYFERGKSSVYRWIAELEDVALIYVREHGNVVFDMPYAQLANNSAKAHAIDAQVKKNEAKLMNKIEKDISAMESTLGRSLTDIERKAYITRRSADA